MIPGSGRSPEEGNGDPLQYCCLENPMDRGDWWVTVHGVTNSYTIEQLSMHSSFRLPVFFFLSFFFFFTKIMQQQTNQELLEDLVQYKDM